LVSESDNESVWIQTYIVGGVIKNCPCAQPNRVPANSRQGI